MSEIDTFARDADVAAEEYRRTVDGRRCVHAYRPAPGVWRWIAAAEGDIKSGLVRCLHGCGYVIRVVVG